ncbi:ornithine cyclodeaminase [Rhizobium sullae]|uniref:Alanine dehydrogenase n=1 Tax=Rhizobium sullae TaxID=50338 RepID=A0A4R3Q123_RHISU|nr:ornithine cyclodeaminase [Rhizobium sullae]TCU14730.1 alanine dehydrogenase [Rhizobium sullae]
METVAGYFSHSDMACLGVSLNVDDLHKAAKEAWSDIRMGRAHGLKSILSFSEADLWKRPEFQPYRNELKGERLGWKLSALSSVGGRYAAVKVVGANAINRRFGQPRSASTIILLDSFTLRPLCLMDGTEISAARTATYASVTLERFFLMENDISVFLFGAGPIAEEIVKALGHLGKDIISTIYVRSRSGVSAQRLVEKCGPTAGVPLEAVSDNRNLRNCRFVITASNASTPVFAAPDIFANAVLLHLGGDETPVDHIQTVLRSGLAVCDDVSMVSRRNSQSLALYFSRMGATLEQLGPFLGVTDFIDVADRVDVADRPILITCVGLPMLDLYVAAHVYETWLRPGAGAAPPSSAPAST